MTLAPGLVPRPRLVLLAGALLLSACAQFTTSTADRAALKTAADQAGADYRACVVNAAEPYLHSGEGGAFIVLVAKQNCVAARSGFLDADTALLNTEFMAPDALRAKNLALLEDQATQQVQEQVLARKQSPPALPASPVPPPQAGNAYLACMGKEGERYGSLNEAATVIAEVANSHCATLLPAASAVALEKEGRTLVMGLVLDKKLNRP